MATVHNVHLLMVSGEYPPDTGNGGIGTYSKHMAECMAELGHRVSVITRSISNEESVAVLNKVTVYRVPPVPYPLPHFRWAYPLRRWCTRYFPHTLIRLSWSLAVAKKIKKMLKTTPRFDCIEAPECGAEGLFLSRRMGRCRVVRMHTPWEMIRRLDRLNEPWGDRIALPLLEKTTARKADGHSAPSQAVAGEIARRWHIQSIVVIRNPLPLEGYRLSTGNDWIYTGRIERRKGIHHLISAYARCRQHNHPPPLTLIGRAYGSDPDGRAYGQTIRSMIDNYALVSSIRWIEHAGLEEVAGHLQNSAVAFFPSLWENFPYACLEAMASGCVVVATRCGGFPEIVTHAENGLLVKPDSPQALESAMAYLIRHPECKSSMGRAARSYVERTLAPECIGNEMERFYRHLMER